jgi:excisionase family DNA binding protein
MGMSKVSSDDKRRPITLAEAAQIYGFNHNYLTELARRGRLRAAKSGGTWLTTPADVEDYIVDRKKRGVYRDDITLDNT